MNKNILIGLFVLAAVVVGGVFLLRADTSDTNSLTATSTATGATSTDATNPPGTTSQAGAPVVITNNTGTPSNSTVVLTGKVTPNGAQTSYWFEYGKTNSFGSRTAAQSIGSGFIAISAPTYITGLSATTIYTYRLVAQNSFGTIYGATYTISTNNNPPAQGNAPTTKTNAATNVSRTNANINGQANPNGSQTSYWFEYGESAELGSVTTIQSAGQGTAVMETSISLSSLKPLTKYYFRVNAQNQYGTVNGAILNFTTPGSAASSSPTTTTTGASSVTTSSVVMNGKVNPNGSATTYWFEYSKDPLLSVLVGNAPPAVDLGGSGTTAIAVSVNIPNLTKNTKYFYRLVAANAYGRTSGAIVSVQTKN